MSVRGAVAGCVVLACLVVLLAERTEGHITFFSPKEILLMKEREGKKDMEPRSEDGQFEDVTVRQAPQMDPENTLDLDIRLSPKQLDQVAPVLEDIIHDLVAGHQKAK